MPQTKIINISVFRPAPSPRAFPLICSFLTAQVGWKVYSVFWQNFLKRMVGFSILALPPLFCCSDHQGGEARGIPLIWSKSKGKSAPQAKKIEVFNTRNAIFNRFSFKSNTKFWKISRLRRDSLSKKQ